MSSWVTQSVPALLLALSCCLAQGQAVPRAWLCPPCSLTCSWRQRRDQPALFLLDQLQECRRGRISLTLC